MVIGKASIVVDLGFGDSGKGTIVDYLTRHTNVSAVVRFNGGAQAAHNVHTLGRHHTFSQFGSGTFVRGVETFLSRFVLVDPFSLMREAEHLKGLGEGDVLTRLTIDPGALVVTPYHKAANRIRESLRGSARHGSVGMGVGETKADELSFPVHAIRAIDLRSPEVLLEKLTFFRQLKYEEFCTRLDELSKDLDLKDEYRLLTDTHSPRHLACALWKIGMRVRLADATYLKRVSERGDLVFEGAQGVLIDEWHGFHPYTTWSTTTFDNPMELLSDIGYRGSIERIGVIRAYATRHGAGPFPTEDADLCKRLPDPMNTFGRWQGGFRIGHLDTVLLRYAKAVCGHVDTLAVTNVDRIDEHVRIARAYMVENMLPREQSAVVQRDGRIWSLKKKPMLTDLLYQEMLMGLLGRVRPVYGTVRKNDIVDTIERELGIPVRIVSYGPTAADKVVRTSALSKKAS